MDGSPYSALERLPTRRADYEEIHTPPSPAATPPPLNKTISRSTVMDNNDVPYAALKANTATQQQMPPQQHHARLPSSMTPPIDFMSFTSANPPVSSIVVTSECRNLLTSPSATADDIYHAAAIYVHDALALRSIDHGLSSTAIAVYMFRLHGPWFTVIRILGVCQLLLAIIEAPSSINGVVLPDHWSAFIEMLLLLVFAFDTALTYVALTYNGFVHSPWRVSKVVVLVISMIDCIIIMAAQERWFPLSRLLRVFFLIERSGRLRKVTKSLIKAAPVIGNVVFLLAIHILIFGFIGWMTFADLEQPPIDPTENQELYFTTITESFINLFICLTNANFPDVMMPVYRVNRWTFLFFLAFNLIGLYLLMQLVLAVIFHTFKNHTVTEMKYYAKRSERAMRAAFYLLGEVEVRRDALHSSSWWNMMRHVRQDITEAQAMCMFKSAQSLNEKHSHHRDRDDDDDAKKESADESKDSAFDERKDDASSTVDDDRERVRERRARWNEESMSINFEQFKVICQLAYVEFVPFDAHAKQLKADRIAHSRQTPLKRAIQEAVLNGATSLNVSLLQPARHSSDNSHNEDSRTKRPSPVKLKDFRERSDEQNEDNDSDVGSDNDSETEGADDDNSSFSHPAHIAHRVDIAACPRLSMYLQRVYDKCRRALSWRSMDIIVDILCTIMFFLIVIQAEIWYPHADATSVPSNFTASYETLTILQTMIAVFFLVEVGAKLFLLRFAFFYQTFLLIDMFLVFVVWIGMIFGFAGYFITVSYYLRAMRLLRVGRALSRLQSLLRTLAVILPAIIPLLVLQTMVFYVYSIIGMRLFAGIMVPGKIDPDSDYAHNGYWENNFDDLTHSYVTLFELLIGNNWYYTMNAAVEATGSQFSMIYFISFYCFAVLVVMNVLTAFILEAFIMYQVKEEKQMKVQKRIKKFLKQQAQAEQLVSPNSASSTGTASGTPQSPATQRNGIFNNLFRRRRRSGADLDATVLSELAHLNEKLPKDICLDRLRLLAERDLGLWVNESRGTGMNAVFMKLYENDAE